MFVVVPTRSPRHTHDEYVPNQSAGAGPAPAFSRIVVLLHFCLVPVCRVVILAWWFRGCCVIQSGNFRLKVTRAPKQTNFFRPFLHRFVNDERHSNWQPENLSSSYPLKPIFPSFTFFFFFFSLLASFNGQVFQIRRKNDNRKIPFYLWKQFVKAHDTPNNMRYWGEDPIGSKQ